MKIESKNDAISYQGNFLLLTVILSFL